MIGSEKKRPKIVSKEYPNFRKTPPFGMMGELDESRRDRAIGVGTNSR